MTRRRLPSVAAVALLAALALGGCQSETESYCDTLADRADRLRSLAGDAAENPGGGLEESVTLLTELGEQAPDDVADDWQTLLIAVQGLVDTLETAGIDPAAPDLGSQLDALPVEEQETVAAAVQELGSAEVTEAGRVVEDHAGQVCDVDLRVG